MGSKMQTKFINHENPDPKLLRSLPPGSEGIELALGREPSKAVDVQNTVAELVNIGQLPDRLIKNLSAIYKSSR
jgi:hypothetical protein